MPKTVQDKDLKVNEVRINGETVMTTRGDSVSQDSLLLDATATDKAGRKISGQLIPAPLDEAYLISDPVGTIESEDYVPFNDVSDTESPKKKTLFSAIIDKLKGVFLEKHPHENYTFGNDSNTLNMKFHNIDATKADNDVSSTQFPSTFNVLDKNGKIFTRTESIVKSDGTIGWYSYVRNYDTSGTAKGQKGIKFTMDKTGDITYDVDPRPFRKAINSMQEIGSEIPENADLDTYVGTGTYTTYSNARVATLSNCPSIEMGKLLVLALSGDNNYRIQLYIEYASRRVFIRRTMDNGSSWGTWIRLTNENDMIYNAGKSIPANADLNTYVTTGSYYCETDGNARTMSNLPYTGNDRGAFKLMVMSTRRATNSFIQFFIPYATRNTTTTDIAYRTTDDNGSTWTDWVHITRTESVHTLAEVSDAAHLIASNDDLNNYTTSGTFHCKNATIASSLSNCPVTVSFKLVVDKAYNNDNSEVTQRITCQNKTGSTDWVRTKEYSQSTWGDWKHIASIDDISSAQLGNGYATGTISGTAITATITNFKLVAGAIAEISLDNNVPINATLNISNTGAKDIKWWNANTSVRNMDIPHLVSGCYTFMYTGSVYLIIAYNRSATVSAQSYVADTSGNIVITAGAQVNAYQLKYRLSDDRLYYNYFKNSAWAGDKRLARYDELTYFKGNQITANQDLDTYMTAGTYYCDSNATAETVSNMPIPSSGKLIVHDMDSAERVVQIYFTNNQNYGGKTNATHCFMRTISNDGTAYPWQYMVDCINGKLALYHTTTTADDDYVGINVGITDSTTNQSYTRSILRTYQDHQASSAGFNLLLDSGGSTVIGAGEAATSFYSLMPKTSENIYLLSDNNIHLEGACNTIANRAGFRLGSTDALLLPEKAEVITDNFGQIGESSHKLKDIYTYKINGATPATSDNVIVSKQDYDSAPFSSLDDVPINTAGRARFANGVAPIDNIALLYLCYGLNDNYKSIELTRVSHANKNSEEKWYNAKSGDGWTGWMAISRTGNYVGVCDSAANVQNKVVTVDSDFSLKKGVRICVKFTYTNSFSSQTSTPITLNVNGTGAKNIWYWSTHSGAGNTGTNTTPYGQAGRYVNYYYDGTYWVWDGMTGELDTVDPRALGSGYGTCDTAASTTAKEVTMSNYSLRTGGVLCVKFTNAVPASATMNINGKGAKNIYYKGSAITAGIINAGDRALFVYNGSQYDLLAVDSSAKYKYAYNTGVISGYSTYNDVTILRMSVVNKGGMVFCSVAFKFATAKTISSYTVIVEGMPAPLGMVFGIAITAEDPTETHFVEIVSSSTTGIGQLAIGFGTYEANTEYYCTITYPSNY